MKNVTIRLVAAIAGVIALVGLATASAHGAATLVVSANPWPATAGQNVTVTGRVTGGEQCLSWTLTFDGQTVSGTDGTTSSASEAFARTWVASGAATHSATATCTVRTQTGYSGTTTAVLTATLDPAATVAAAGALPNTGGVSLWWLIAALLALVAGGGLFGWSRREREAEQTA